MQILLALLATVLPAAAGVVEPILAKRVNYAPLGRRLDFVGAAPLRVLPGSCPTDMKKCGTNSMDWCCPKNLNCVGTYYCCPTGRQALLPGACSGL